MNRRRDECAPRKKNKNKLRIINASKYFSRSNYQNYYQTLKVKYGT